MIQLILTCFETRIYQHIYQPNIFKSLGCLHYSVTISLFLPTVMSILFIAIQYNYCTAYDIESDNVGMLSCWQTMHCAVYLTGSSLHPHVLALALISWGSIIFCRYWFYSAPQTPCLNKRYRLAHLGVRTINYITEIYIWN